jgi:hypothetical protein
MLTHVTMEEIFIGSEEVPTAFRGVSYSCQACLTVLGVGPDPAAVQDDTVEKVCQRIEADLVQVHAAIERLRRAKS